MPADKDYKVILKFWVEMYHIMPIITARIARQKKSSAYPSCIHMGEPSASVCSPGCVALSWSPAVGGGAVDCSVS